ncbi:MAG: 5-dehydro-2-deoxygluconokinase [Rhizobiaceae bacterium]
MDLANKLAAKKFLVIGRAGMDLSPSPAGTSNEDAESFKAGLGGSSANIAVGLRKLDCSADLLTRVSDDSIGRFCVKQLASYDVGTQYVTPVGGEYRNSIALYESRVEGHQTVIYRNGAADFQMDEVDVSAPDYTAYSALITAGTVFAAEPSRSASFKAFDFARKAGLPVIFDIDYRPYSWPSADVASDVLSRAGAACDLIVGNDEEFGFMAGSYDNGLTKARELVETTAQCVVYKRGELGSITITKGSEFESGIFPVDALKPTGAGDSFMAGFVSSIANGYSLEEAVTRGSACAAITVSKVGCAPAMPDTTQLEEFLEMRTA